ncbi:MAG: ActS/PrrB/RegB family redox-sensitive histidine kinase [Pseudomonadota bacterium]
MQDSIFSEMLRGEARGRWVRLRTLTTLRWLAVLGQAGAVVAADQIFGISLPLELCSIAIVGSIVFNVVSMQVYPPTTRLNERAATLSMLFDLCQVSALLAITGGLTNPFAVLLLAPVTISASALPLRSTVVVGLTALGLITVMTQWSLPLAFTDGQVIAPPPIYVFGVWAALTISIFFMTFYARRVSVENFRMSRALRAAEAALSREQRLTAIGGLAAAAAHELGTPLATIKLVSSELVDELSDDEELREDAELIRSQADRCRDILADLSQGGRSDEHIRTVPISALIAEAAEPHNDRGVRIIVRVGGAPPNEVAEQAHVARRPEVVHGLRNLIQNAVDFAETTIWIDANETGSSLRVTVGDDGAGFPEEVLQRLGDPYVTSRPRQALADRESAAGEYKGMGLGLFIAKTLLERTGARVSYANAERKVRRANRGAPLETRRPSGAVVAAVWPKDMIVASTEDTRGALGQNPRFSLENI